MKRKPKKKPEVKMKFFHVTGIVKGSKYIGLFEAETEAAAVALALESEDCYVSLCHQCNSECEDGEIQEAVASEAEEIDEEAGA